MRVNKSATRAVRNPSIPHLSRLRHRRSCGWFPFLWLHVLQWQPAHLQHVLQRVEGKVPNLQHKANRISKICTTWDRSRSRPSSSCICRYTSDVKDLHRTDPARERHRARSCRSYHSLRSQPATWSTVNHAHNASQGSICLEGSTS